MSEIKRRVANEGDLQAVHAIYTDKSVSRYLGYEPMPLDDFRLVFTELLADGGFFVVEQECSVVGFYRIIRNKGRTAHVARLGTLAVAPPVQGKGVAENMLTQVIDELRESGVKRIELIVESDNPRALSFYKRFGFVKEGTLKNFYKRAEEKNYIDDYLMARIFDG
ncbi:MAG: GNAT family N-acetyltransferase [Gammaproteobacteria bacterium]|nr:GNAT family N-acetyltransferase [Gammaproteobacteria bacterium]